MVKCGHYDNKPVLFCQIFFFYYYLSVQLLLKINIQEFHAVQH